MIGGKVFKLLKASLKARGKALEIILLKNSLEYSFKTKIRRCLMIGSSNQLYRASKKMSRMLRATLLIKGTIVAFKEENLKVKFQD